MKVGDLAKIVWTEITASSPALEYSREECKAVLGVVTKLEIDGGIEKGDTMYHRHRALLYVEGKLNWFDLSELEVVS